jgi:hypothetical protein
MTDNRDWLTKCLYCDKEDDGYECWLGRKVCIRLEHMPINGFRESGICLYYNEAHEVNHDGTEIKSDKKED